MNAMLCRLPFAVFLLALAHLGSARQASSLQRVLDEGSFAILRDGHVIGREDFTIREGVVGGFAGGFIITTTAYYPADRPLRTMSAVIQVHPDSQIASARFDATNGARHVSLIEFGQRRVTIRMGAPGRESTREYPSRGFQHVYHDSLFGHYTMLSLRAAGPVALISPRDGRRGRGTISVHGTERTVVGGTQRTVRRVTIETEWGNLDLWFDPDGRLLKMSLPSREVTVERRAFARD